MLPMQQSGTPTRETMLEAKDALVTTTTPTPLERAVARYGDSLYRLALLLNPDDTSAATALRSTATQLSGTPPTRLDEPTLIAALLAALPPERRRPWKRGLPSWARVPSSHPTAALLAALARLPRQERLALGLLLLQSLEAEPAARVFGGDEQRLRASASAALRALAPHVRPPIAPEQLEAGAAPAECRSTRAALALGGDLAHADAATRGHLALCAACREAELTWQRLTTTVEQALRGALRSVARPEHLDDEQLAALTHAPEQQQPSSLNRSQLRLALVALAVLAIIGVLVLPHRREATTLVAGSSASTAVAPHDLAQRALDQLYNPPQGSGVWHGRWEIRWSFAAGSYADLNAEAWIDTAAKRHRVQLVHSAGGGPFEFELANEDGNLWYAVAPSYAPSLYASMPERALTGVQFQVAPEAQTGMLRARLESGAWGIAGDYLRQALAADELRSWGRQRSGATTLEVIGFDGVSPLLPPSDAPEAVNLPTTILLSIDADSGALYEVRELIGPAGGERTTRTTWRFTAGEWLAEPAVIASAFDIHRAWNGAGDFARRADAPADPALPLTSAAQIASLPQLVQTTPLFWLPATPPPGATRALLLTEPGTIGYTYTYLGADRRLSFISTTDLRLDDLRLNQGERINLNGLRIVLQALNSRGYQAQLRYRGAYDTQVQTTVWASGYTRAELLDVLRGFGPPTAASFRSQAGLFANPQPTDHTAFEALLGAIERPAPPVGNVRYFVEHMFSRHRAGPDALGDPYHMPPYGGRPETMEIENWTHVDAQGRIESGNREHDSTGTIFAQQYLGPEITWYYDAPSRHATRIRSVDLALGNTINLDQAIALDLLGRGGSRLLTLPDGTRVISQSQPILETQYASVLQNQQQVPDAGGPYLGDIASDATLTTRIILDVNGQPRTIERWASSERPGRAAASATTPNRAQPGAPPQNTILLESWELADDKLIAPAQAPQGIFDQTPPDALSVSDNILVSANTPAEPRTTTPIEAAQIAPSPLFLLDNAEQVDAPLVEIGEQQNTPDGWGNDIFDGALRRGLAIRMTYWLTTGGSLQRTLILYQGDARVFGNYLRAQTTPTWRWKSSQPVRLTIGVRSVNGWRIVMAGGATWTLFELDGTLLAAQADSDVQQTALSSLRRYTISSTLR
jgi:hypothetical protein